MTISQGQGVSGNDIIPLSSLQLIGISGHAGVGKDTVAQYLAEKYENVYGEAFAEPLKRACAAAFGLPLHWFHDRELKEQPTDWEGITTRKIAQFVGTEMFRNLTPKLYGTFGRSHWIRLLEMRLTGLSAPPEGQGFYSPGDTVIITDVRFQDEADWIRANGGIILRVKRQGCDGNVGLVGRASETSYVSPDYLLYNDYSMEDLYASINRFIHTFTSKGILKLTPRKEESTNGYSESSF